MRLPAPVTALVTTCAVLALGACAGDGGGGDGGGDRDAPTSVDAPTEEASAAVEADGTEPGTDLAFGDTATLVWQPTADLTGEVDLTVDSVAEQRRSVFDGWIREGAIAEARPYFVTVTLANVGDADLGGVDVPLYLHDTADRLGAPWTLGGDFTDCQSGPLPVPFAAGEETQACLVYLVPDGERIDDLVFEPTEGYDPISWTGEVATPERTRARGQQDRD